MEYIFWYTVYMTGTLFFVVMSIVLAAFLFGMVKDIFNE
jgi:hypothetical protein